MAKTMRDFNGQRIVLTRSAEDCAAWAHRLQQCGAEAVILPCIGSELIDSAVLRHGLEERIGDADWLIFTSRRGVEALATLYDEALAATVKVAVVGSATAEAARAVFGRVDLIGSGTAAALADALTLEFTADATKCVLAVAENAGEALEEKLRCVGASCVRLNVYRTVPVPVSEPKQALSTLAACNVFLASPSAVTGFVNQVDTDTDANFITIGPSTTAAVQSRGLAVAAEAHTPSLEGLLEALKCLN